MHGQQNIKFLVCVLAASCLTVFVVNDADVPNRFHNVVQWTSAILCCSGFRIHTLLFPPLNTINNASLEYLRACYSQYE